MRKRLSLKHYIMIPLAVLLASMLVITILTIQSLTSMQKTIMENNLNSFSSQVAQIAEKTYSDIYNIAESIAYNQLIQNYLTETDAEAKRRMYDNISSLLHSSVRLNNSILDIAIFGESGNKVNIQGDIESYAELYEQYKNDHTKLIRFLKSNFIIGSREYNTQVAIMPIYRMTNMISSYIGVLFITLDPTVAITGSSDFEIEGVSIEFILTDEYDSLITGDSDLYQALMTAAERENDWFELPYDGIVYEGQAYHIVSADNTLYTLVRKNEYTQDVIQIMSRQFAFFICAFLITIVILFMFLRPILSSLKQLTHIMNEISSGKRRAMNKRIPIVEDERCCEEVYSIATAFNDMLDETNRLNHAIFDTYSKMYELEMANRATEIAYLRSQINPHFLYNTLTLICGLSAEGETDSVVDVTQALSQIFRYSIKGNDFVSVSEELEITKSYVMIQMIRFEDRFSVEYDFTEEAMIARIPKMIIQPLVENAIKHGLEKLLKKGTLKISGRRDKEADTLILTITDTGVGIPAGRLAKLKERLASTSEPNRDAAWHNSDSIGVTNVNSRIYLYYGAPYGIHVESEENVGTIMRITIPYNTV